MIHVHAVLVRSSRAATEKVFNVIVRSGRRKNLKTENCKNFKNIELWQSQNQL